MRYNTLLFLMASTIASTAVYAESLPKIEVDKEPVISNLILKDSLDRPQDGYCLDIPGSEQYLRNDTPLTAHNCKGDLYADEYVLYTKGYLYLPATKQCVTAMGLNGRALPGSSLMSRECGEMGPFVNTDGLQKFTLKENGQVQLNNSNLCLTVGEVSASTFEPTHRWRALFMSDCSTASPTRSQWKLTPVNLPS